MTKIESQLQLLLAGTQKNIPATSMVGVNGQQMKQADIVAKLQGWIQLLVQKDAAIHIDGVAGEARGIGFADWNPFLSGNQLFDLTIGNGVESRRIVQHASVFQRTETGVQMVKPWVNQAQ